MQTSEGEERLDLRHRLRGKLADLIKRIDLWLERSNVTVKGRGRRNPVNVKVNVEWISGGWETAFHVFPDADGTYYAGIEWQLNKAAGVRIDCWDEEKLIWVG